ncbi:MAG: aminotransferase class I/II-fold pyridoxal phosphate-dependent enzyme [Muribaculaceae bacterium]|nr:aminotransferase class I/II-fold pyridoxal phosphate-dependent enzyme [Muribaculaceae bacterium]
MHTHGGDIYRNQITLDFSVNTNPLGTPEAVKAALHNAVGLCAQYPDIKADKLKKAVARMLNVSEEYLLFGNGASELFMAITRGIRAKKIVIPIPSFYGYEYAAKAAGGELIFYETKQENHFCIMEEIESFLTEDVDILFLANPNNPTGNLMDRDGVRRLLQHCKDRGIFVVLDECFVEFSGTQFSMLSEIEAFKNLILVRAFTKIFAIPGVRLGYLLCSDDAVLTRITRQLPEWNLSCFAQEAGCICATQTNFVRETEAYVKMQRRFLEEGLLRQGFQIFPSKANFILFYGENSFYESLLAKGILIRDCENFRGLGKGFYRIAVKQRRENEILLEAIADLQIEKGIIWGK